MSSYVCLMYHDVCPDHDAGHERYSKLSPSIRSYTVTARRFAEQVAAIGSERWLDPEELRQPDIRANGDGRPRVLITFDDGWAGSLLEAGPILADAGARAIVFVTTGLIGHPMFATEAMLRDLPVDLFEIGSHTVTHPFLAECSSDVIRRELGDSRSELEQILGRRVDSISIPNGSVDDRVLGMAEECGYELVFTSEARVNSLNSDHRSIGRVAVRSATATSSVVQWSNGLIGAAGWRNRLLEVPRGVLGPKRYRRLRSWALGGKPGQDDMGELVARYRRAAAAPLSSLGMTVN
jgi:peptidoglycan/xylan/chitin deacetylase (PgdA/CDA1 family)